MDLLTALKKAEASVGRTPTFKNGPRIVDLDIILYDDAVLDIPMPESPLDEYSHQGLIIPHPRMQEREFVLRPLAE